MQEEGPPRVLDARLGSSRRRCSGGCNPHWGPKVEERALQFPEGNRMQSAKEEIAALSLLAVLSKT